ncbi:N-acetylmuramoyl-L-alanine amidase [Clostridium tertium]|uniref:N-acetylmuramoyl-L-alanine amidase n=1 Tax=Clostridium tertium TaxID=1559 RepID=UPI00374EF1F3
MKGMILMKIAVRGGHNFLATGCSALIDETTEDRKVKDSVIKYLNQLGHTVLDVTPGNMDTNSDLVYGVSRANNWGADLFISIHFNKAYNSYNGAIGTETWVYSESDNYNDEEYAKRIVDSIGALGFKNRGVKTSIDLYELKHTTMPSVIVEVCFVEATEDVALYKKLGSDKIGQVIAEAIANKKIEVKVEYDMKKLVTYYGDADVYGAVMVAQKNRCPLMKVSDYKASGIKAEQVIQIGGKAEDTNRYVTFKNAAKLV